MDNDERGRMALHQIELLKQHVDEAVKSWGGEA